ncbi:hypothetical protein RvY_01924, partial [Ramazzottius varieornatus]
MSAEERYWSTSREAPSSEAEWGTDCGLFALAIKTEFLLEKDPSEARSYQANTWMASMRTYYEQCLEVERIERAFPPAPRHRPGKNETPAFEIGVFEHVR